MSVALMSEKETIDTVFVLRGKQKEQRVPCGHRENSRQHSKKAVEVGNKEKRNAISLA